MVFLCSTWRSLLRSQDIICAHKWGALLDGHSKSSLCSHHWSLIFRDVSIIVKCVGYCQVEAFGNVGQIVLSSAPGRLLRRLISTADMLFTHAMFASVHTHFSAPSSSAVHRAAQWRHLLLRFATLAASMKIKLLPVSLDVFQVWNYDPEWLIDSWLSK